jgi:hypothetical protein
MMRPLRICPCFDHRVYRRLRAVSLTLLSDSLMTKFMKQDMAAEQNDVG